MLHLLRFTWGRFRWWLSDWKRQALFLMGRQEPAGRRSDRVLEKLFQCLDLIGLFCVYEILLVWIKAFSVRTLTAEEKQFSQALFGPTFPVDLVRIDERALIGSRTHRVAYVSFFTINVWGGMSRELFVHEIVHVWQYLQLGPVYIPRALAAQRSRMGYNYGGLNPLRDSVLKQTFFDDFNLEQQAEIVTDWYRLRNGLAPQYGDAGWQDHWVYDSMLKGEGLLPSFT